jgi:hypothetical protein
MQPVPDYPQSYPPPPPPPQKRSHKTLWIILGIAAIVLCLCCVVLIVGVYFFQLNIPVISNFFPSPTPAGLPYSNPSAGISLTYPTTWQYSDSGDATNGFTIIFASSADILKDPTSAPQTGAAMAIMTNLMKTSDVTFTVDASSMGSVVDYIASTYFSNISGGQNLRTFTISGNPAASGVYTLTNSSGAPATAYLVTVLRNSEILLFFGVCPQTEWAQYQPAFDSIVNSAVIVTP